MAARFGTDGVRGLANRERLTPELVLALGRAAARVLGDREGSGPPPGHPRFVVGRDTRRSGPLLAAALTAGLMAEGADVVDVGVLPTPAVAALAAAYGIPAAVVSASHNPFPDNGIKLFAPGGRKLDGATEAEIEALVASQLLGNGAPPASDALVGAPPAAPVAPVGAAVGTLVNDPDAPAWYRRQLVAALEGRRLDGLRVVVDCGHGAATATAVDAFADAGAAVVAALAVEPDGTNINDACGSTDTTALQVEVVARGADLGLAFDGDADRVIAVDGAGSVVDGDRLLALFATDLQDRGRLADDTVVVTVMTNLGFHQAMARAGVRVHATDVGDRNVLAALDRHGWSLGGEQSGHLIFRDLATTGDGVLSGLLLADLVARQGRPLAEAALGAMDRLPQVLRNVPVADRAALPDAGAVWAEVKAVEAGLGADGRVLLRSSGTENLVRVMVEASTHDAALAAADQLAAAVMAVLGPAVPSSPAGGPGAPAASARRGPQPRRRL